MKVSKMRLVKGSAVATLAGFAALALATTGMQAGDYYGEYEERVERTSTVRYMLVRSGDVDATNDKMVTIGKPTDTDNIPITTPAGQNGCGNYYGVDEFEQEGYVESDVYKTTDTYYNSFAMILSGNNSKGARIPLATAFQNYNPNPGVKATDLVLFKEHANDSGECQETVGGVTMTFTKYYATFDN